MAEDLIKVLFAAADESQQTRTNAERFLHELAATKEGSQPRSARSTESAPPRFRPTPSPALACPGRSSPGSCLQIIIK